MMGGQLFVESAVDKGSSFWFKIDFIGARGHAKIEKRSSHQKVRFKGDSHKSRIEGFHPETEPISMIPPPLKELSALKDAAETGAVTDIKHCLDHIKELGPEYQPFVSEIQKFKDQYKFNEILDFIKMLSTGEK